MSLYRNFLSVGGLTLVSRVFGFVRDALMAAVLGISPVSDAFNAAFRFPNLFRRLFAEGAFNTAFVPMFSGALETQGAEGAKELASRIMSWLVVAILVVTLLVELFTPQIMVVFVPGFVGDQEKFDLTVFLTRIMFPYLACMSLMAAYAAILNSMGRFVAAAFAPIVLNIVNIAALVPLALMTLAAPETAFWVAVATMLGGVAQLALVYWAIRRAGMVPTIRLPRLDPEVRRFWVLAVPAIIAGGITQINIFVGTVIASGANEVMSIIYNADRLYQLPLGIIGIAIGTVLLPELSRHLSAGRDLEARQSQSQSLFLSMFLSMPAAGALIALALPVVRVLFERGAFGPSDSVLVSQALVAFAVGLPAFVLIRVLQPGFFSRKDTRTPTIFAGISLVVNVVLSLALFESLRHVGIALATSVAAWVNVVLLAAFLARRGHFTMTGTEWRQQALILLLTLVMSGALWGTVVLLGPVFDPGYFFPVQALALLALCIVGAALYFALAHVTRVQPLGGLLRRLRRSRR
ncbi:murein biosynthesis integral membrane protein MurJ [Devosia sp. ZB163]|uniref:murein biosynthesis integral membrane protein MurJ n=1 Tax=Devosia sp. ZB163 TaxID=3025938 RepID=UPI0023627C53|nr:murein biosynthesis integral membrane protein MurJ [Devosia sp. ZB163]MDC9822490.1 murein biosynthesis integral membrane protein MurJ [Devosia sp. ZB163]